MAKAMMTNTVWVQKWNFQEFLLFHSFLSRTMCVNIRTQKYFSRNISVGSNDPRFSLSQWLVGGHAFLHHTGKHLFRKVSCCFFSLSDLKDDMVSLTAIKTGLLPQRPFNPFYLIARKLPWQRYCELFTTVRFCLA